MEVQNQTFMQHFFFYIAVASVLLGLLSALLIAADLIRHPQPMRIMNAVWILTGLWATVFGLAAYYAFGRAPRRNTRQMGQMKNMKMPDMTMPDMKMPMKMPARPRWQGVILSTLHCGAGCTLADLAGEWLLFFVPVAIGGSLIAGTWVTEYLLALAIGIGFQYAAIRGMERIDRGQAIVRAAKADFFSLTAWQAGMYIWMGIVIFGMEGGTLLPRTTFTFWFMMQTAMGVGFLLALPVNLLLIRAGVKKAM